MSIFCRAAVLLGLALGMVGCGTAADNGDGQVVQLEVEGKIVQTVNGIEIPQSLVEAVAKGRGLNLDQPAQRQQVLDEVVQYVLLAEQAEKLHLQQQPELAALIEAARLRGAANAAVTAYERSHPVTDAMVAADYQRQLDQVGDKTYRFTQLLFADAATANAAAAELQDGTPFADVFDSYRLKASNARSYPNVLPRQLPAELAAALVALQPGDATRMPVKSSMGWHLIYLDGVNSFQAPPLASVQEQLRAKLEQEQARAYVESLTEDATITMVNPANTSTKVRPATPAEGHMERSPKVVHDAAPAAPSTANE